MPKFFVDRMISDEETDIRITGEDKHHMTDVLRLRPGDVVEAGDLSGRSFKCKLISSDSYSAELKIVERSNISKEPGMRITVFQGLPKSDKMEQIIQKCTELGASEITPVICARSVSRLREERDIIKKTERWQKIAAEAAKQSSRDMIPAISRPVEFSQAVVLASESSLSFLPWELETGTDLKGFLAEQKKTAGSSLWKPDTISFMIGPEGGFDSHEVTEALDIGITAVTLGKRILRTETAAPAVLAMLIYEFEMGAAGS